METIRLSLGAEWNEEMEAAWHDGIEAIVAAMTRIAESGVDAAATSHQRHLPEIRASAPLAPSDCHV